MVAAFKRKRWRDAQRLRLDLNGVLAEIVGPTGVDHAEIVALLPALAELVGPRGGRSGKVGGTGVLATSAELRGVLALAGEVRAGVDEIVVLGGAGAVAGAKLLLGTLPALQAREALEGAPRVRVVDTIDPDALAPLLDRLDLRRTVFDVVSVSGDRPETLGAFLIVRDRLLKELGAVEYKRQVVVTTARDRGALRQIVHDEGFRDVPLGTNPVAGALSLAAVFPAACAGIDVAELLAGAAFIEGYATDTPAEANPVLLLAAALHLVAERRGAAVALRPFAAGLGALSDWFGRTAADAFVAASAERPSSARPGAAGAVVPVFVRVDERAGELTIPSSYEDLEAAAYLGGLDAGALLNLAQDAAEIARARAGAPSLTIRAPRLNAFVLGELVTLLATATAWACLLGAREPAVDGAGVADVEDARALTYGLAGRPGFESQRAEAQRWLARREARFVV